MIHLRYLGKIDALQYFGAGVYMYVLFLCGALELLLHNFRGYHSITKSLITLQYLNQLNLSTLVMPPLVATHI
ncbi:hypothetical protein WDU94_002601 [Cyamophila willieti]